MPRDLLVAKRTKVVCAQCYSCGIDSSSGKFEYCHCAAGRLERARGDSDWMIGKTLAEAESELGAASGRQGGVNEMDSGERLGGVSCRPLAGGDAGQVKLRATGAQSTVEPTVDGVPPVFDADDSESVMTTAVDTTGANFLIYSDGEKIIAARYPLSKPGVLIRIPGKRGAGL